MPHRLSDEEFLWVIARAPLIAFDLIVRDEKGRVLLGRRRNPPAQGTWFVPGGRIRKDEPLEEAFLRITAEELGRPWPRASSRFLGVYEHFHPDNFAGVPGITTHYIVLAHELPPDAATDPPPKAQHSEYRWWPVNELIHHPEVHLCTKAYFVGRSSCSDAAP